MDIYKINAQSLSLIKEQPFKLEKEMQEMFEKKFTDADRIDTC